MQNTLFRPFGAAIIFLAWLSPVVAATTTLTFDTPIGGTINDANGSGTGFTNRLPGTGIAISSNDPNIDLAVSPGRLRLTSTQADFNQFPGPTGNNLSNLEALSLFRSNVGSNDIFVTALFEGVSVPLASDQLELFAGANENRLLRAGIVATNRYVFTENTGVGDINTFTGANAFSTGNDIAMTLSRQSGLWSLSWINLTTATSGSLPAVALPWLDAEPNLYFGVHAANAGTTTPFVGIIDYFTLTVVPEPSASLLFCSGMAVGLTMRARRRRSVRCPIQLSCC